jgi:hypothetical protein
VFQNSISLQPAAAALHQYPQMMTSSYSIETPVTLLALPGPASGIRAGPVQSISGSRKRKRTEIVLGSDGQSVNIYDVRDDSFSI